MDKIYSDLQSLEDIMKLCLPDNYEEFIDAIAKEAVDNESIN